MTRRDGGTTRRLARSDEMIGELEAPYPLSKSLGWQLLREEPYVLAAAPRPPGTLGVGPGNAAGHTGAGLVSAPVNGSGPALNSPQY
ncbi:hypothetical protein AL504_31215 [Achromobacter xylosoxidans]|uniref:Uncharacterized protein n=1 Tax=Alcaligenes xylosoxydans xylosoxydans TaxID=85698 RepID=A0A2L0PTA0_ALCXX|nr:hypothetical protein AL504_31215 [Achromobacter xylosoxidans]